MHDHFDRIRASLKRSVETERNHLRMDAKVIETDMRQREMFAEMIASMGKDMPADVAQLMADVRRLRRARYSQYLRAMLEELADD